jgi:hypothetical protein
MSTEEELRYPIRKFQFLQPTEKLRAALNDAVKGLTQEQLLSRYRPDG